MNQEGGRGNKNNCTKFSLRLYICNTPIHRACHICNSLCLSLSLTLSVTHPPPPPATPTPIPKHTDTITPLRVVNYFNTHKTVCKSFSTTRLLTKDEQTASSERLFGYIAIKTNPALCVINPFAPDIGQWRFRHLDLHVSPANQR